MPANSPEDRAFVISVPCPTHGTHPAGTVCNGVNVVTPATVDDAPATDEDVADGN